MECSTGVMIMDDIVILPGTTRLDQAEADALREAVEAIGDVELARIAGLSRHSLARCVARFRVHSGTAALARHALRVWRRQAA